MTIILILLLFSAYTFLNYIFPGPLPTYVLGSLIALTSIGLMKRSKVRVKNPFELRISKNGLILLLIPLIYVPIAFFLGRIQPIHQSDIWFGLVSGVSQEIFFRYSLTEILKKAFPGKLFLIIFTQALLFGLWHARAFRTVSFLPAMAVIAGTILVGIIWGIQSQKDKTILFSALEHSLFLIIQ